MKLCDLRPALFAGVLVCLTSLPAQAQSVTCIREPISVATVRGEGLAELMPPIVFTCSGGSEQTQLTFDLDIFLSAEVANPVIGPGPNDIDAVLVATAPPALGLSEEKPPTAGQDLPVLDIIQCQRNPNLNRAISCTNVPFQGISRRYMLRRLRARHIHATNRADRYRSVVQRGHQSELLRRSAACQPPQRRDRSGLPAAGHWTTAKTIHPRERKSADSPQAL